MQNQPLHVCRVHLVPAYPLYASSQRAFRRASPQVGPPTANLSDTVTLFAGDDLLLRRESSGTARLDIPLRAPLCAEPFSSTLLRASRRERAALYRTSVDEPCMTSKRAKLTNWHEVHRCTTGGTRLRAFFGSPVYHHDVLVIQRSDMMPIYRFENECSDESSADEPRL